MSESVPFTAGTTTSPDDSLTSTNVWCRMVHGGNSIPRRSEVVPIPGCGANGHGSPDPNLYQSSTWTLQRRPHSTDSFGTRVGNQSEAHEPRIPLGKEQDAGFHRPMWTSTRRSSERTASVPTILQCKRSKGSRKLLRGATRAGESHTNRKSDAADMATVTRR